MPTSNEADWNRSFSRTAAVFGSLLSITMSVAFCLSRVGFPTHYSGVARVLGLALLILNVAPFGGDRWFRNAPSLVFCVLVGLGMTGWFFPSFGFLGWIFSAVGALLFLFNSSLWLFGNRRQPLFVLVSLLVSLTVGLYVSGQFWGLGYAHPLFEERLAVNLGHIDAPFNSSIANMIRTYGRPSTGLDGIPYVGYHFGSHWLAASLAPLCGETVFEFYNSAIGVLQIPLLYVSLILLAGTIRRLTRNTGDVDRWLPGGALFWTTMILGLLGPFPKKNDMLRLSLMEIYDSDSYTLGLAISFLILALAISFYAEWKRTERPQFFALLVVFPVLFAICGMAKISQAYLLVGMAFYSCLRLGLLQRLIGWLHLAVSGVLFLAVLKVASSPGSTKFAPFNFDRIHPEWIPFFFLLYFAWVWIFLVLRARQLNWKTLSDVRRSFQQNTTFPLEILLFCSLIGMVPYLTLDFGMGSWNYFTQYQTFLGMALVAGFLPSWPGPKPASCSERCTFWTFPVRYVFAFLLGGIALLHVGMTTVSSAYNLLKENVSIRAAVAGHSPDEWRQYLRPLLTTARGDMTEQARARLEVLHSLETLWRVPLAEKKVSVIYIPKTNRAYWGDFRQGGSSGAATPFLVPALTGIAMVNGLPEYDDIPEVRRLGYGYASYTLPTGPGPIATENLSATEQHARNLGFQTLFVMEAGPSGCCAIRKLDLNSTP